MQIRKIVFALAIIAVAGCNSNNPTSPGGGGGMTGGGGGIFDSGTLNAPASFSHTFATAGSFNYFCRFHVSMGMTGNVTVADGEADAVTVMASGTTFSPPNVRIRPGGTVHWNVTSGTHTVTSN